MPCSPLSFFLRAMMPNLEIEATWLRPVVLYLASGPETGAAGAIELASLPAQPFQPATTLPPLVGMKLFIGADVFENRSQRPVMVELEVGFEIDGELVQEPKDQYHLQLTYRAADTWRVVHTEDGKYAKFTFADLDAEGALEASRRKIRIFLDPKENLKGLFRSQIATVETCWLRLELKLIADVGVAGLHRLLAHRTRLRGARVLIVVAGLEGALPSVVGGLTDRPLIAVPTSIGYGSHMRGLAPLLAMLNSCAAGVTVVNIDNGFGAGYAAHLINVGAGRKS